MCCETARCWLLYEQPSSVTTRCESVSERSFECSKSKNDVKLFQSTSKVVPVHIESCFRPLRKLFPSTSKVVPVHIESCSSPHRKFFPSTSKVVPVHIESCSSPLRKLFQFTSKVVPVHIVKAYGGEAECSSTHS